MHLWVVEVKTGKSNFYPMTEAKGVWHTRKQARSAIKFLRSQYDFWEYRIRKYVREE